MRSVWRLSHLALLDVVPADPNEPPPAAPVASLRP
jgi:hypothetical protein